MAIRTLRRLAMGAPSVSPDEILHLPSRDKGRSIKVHVYHPSNIHHPSPILVNFHGSGFIIPMHGSDQPFCRQMSSTANYTIFDAQYRLVPEHPFPAVLDDAEDVVKWVLQRGDEFDLDLLAISGFSAGGNPAAATTFPASTFRCVIAFYPVTDMAVDPGSKKAPDPSGKPIADSVARTISACYLPGIEDKTDPRISPSFAQPSRFLCNVLIITASGDNLALEAESLADRISAESEKHVVCRRMEHCNHA
ncbi:hypothetical protein BHE90_016476 [Fusarium euwallaceae]|uniref:Alpha/beta hydrolase fold-3 domain-containing protein n=1 Tax=Fusarium euwallaceae TaxID=1147111 RepID=A0A430L0D5_9HYPO|nr:hypothetical protein BHE90_016476 [Fusarium euwallaceae]